MKKNKSLLNKWALSYGIASMILLSPLSAKAASIAIVNAGFESPIAPAQGYTTSGAPTGWTSTSPAGTVGVFNPPQAFSYYNTNCTGACTPLTTTYFSPNQAPEGNQTLYLNFTTANGPVGVSQTLSSTLQNNTQYNLSFDISTQRYPFYLADYDVDLLAGSTVLASINNNNSPAVAYRTFANKTLSYISGNNYSALIGQPLKIQITATGIDGGAPAGSTAQANFDDFQLNTATVPEPSTNMGILGLGILGLVALLKKKWN